MDGGGGLYRYIKSGRNGRSKDISLNRRRSEEQRDLNANHSFSERLPWTENYSYTLSNEEKKSLSSSFALSSLAEWQWKVTHGVTVGRVQHGGWKAEQAEELGVPPLLRWQVPAWVDHPQRQQRCRHTLWTEEASQCHVHMCLESKTVTLFTVYIKRTYLTKGQK